MKTCSKLKQRMALLIAAMLATLPAQTTHANLNMTLNLERRDGNFRGSVYMFADGASAPLTRHRIESPNGIIFREVGNSNAQSFTNLSYSAMIAECTAGQWTLTTNVGDPSEEQYGFTVSISGVAEPMFGDTTITNPLDYAATSTNQPLIEWTSTSLFPEVHIQVHNGFQPPEPGNWVNLVAPINSWTPPSPVLGGTNTIYMAYQTNGFGGITIALPTNAVGTAVAEWNADADLSSSDFSHFVATGGSASPLANAVDATELAWTTGGDAPWFFQTYETSDGVDAAASDLTGFGFGESWIETTVIGPGTLDFSWALFADVEDSLVVEVDGNYEDEIYGDWGWDYSNLYIFDSGPVTVRWTFFHYDVDSVPSEAFLDEVVYTPDTPDYSAEINLKIQHNIRNGASTFLAFPRIDFADPVAITTHEIESPTGKFSGGEGTSSSFNLASLDEVIDECTNGTWTLYFNRNSPYEEQYTFSMSLAGPLTTNDLPPVLILNPLDGSTGVSTNPAYSWLGPPNFDELFVSVRDDEAGSTVGFSSLSSTQLVWDGPELADGTNTFFASYTSNGYSGLTITTPSGGYPLSSWSASVELGTAAYSTFVTSSGFVPMPVTLLTPIVTEGSYGLSFVSEVGATHFVEWSTNLVTGPWMPATNFPGNGTTNMIALPTTNAAAFYRIQSQ